MSLSFLLACGCTEGHAPSQTWVGRDVTELKQVWGQPTEETTKPDGLTIVYVSYWRDGPFVTHRCQKTFTVNPKGVVTGQVVTDC
jgi:hypothetical protein